MSNITDHELGIIKDILKSEPYKFYVFGSRARGDNHNKSDLDIVVFSSSKLSVSYTNDLKEKFSASDLPYMVDIVDYNACYKSFQNVIDSEINREIILK